MEFEETLTAYLVENEGHDLNKRGVFEFERLKNELSFCRHHRHTEASIDSHGAVNFEDDRNHIVSHQYCHRCDWMFSELTMGASKMIDYISLKVKQLVHLHFTSGSEKLDCSLICPICLDIVFQPYALSCGHIFCKSCACLAAHVLIIEGLKYASPESKCPVCRESGVYDKSVCMSELGLLLQKRCKQEFKERLIEERNIILKQTKEFWELQTSYAMGL